MTHSKHTTSKQRKHEKRFLAWVRREYHIDIPPDKYRALMALPDDKSDVKFQFPMVFENKQLPLREVAAGT
jgi:hypothetical protein